MYKIMLADDEGIVIDSLKFIIEKEFGRDCEIAYAKTGRSVIELAESFRPDIAIMDIQMPGINGIDAMREIKKSNSQIVFIVMTAYDKFNYAKEAINLGVFEYLNKPIEREILTGVIKKAMRKIDAEREKRSQDLLIREKMETVVPIIENGLIYDILFRESYVEDVENYKSILGIEQDYAYMAVLVCGESQQGSHLTNAVGSSVRIQKIYSNVRETIKEYIPGIVGSAMGNKIAICVPYSNGKMEYNERIEMIERAREMIRSLKRNNDVSFRLGVGSVKPLLEVQSSYNEALDALVFTTGSVVHADDVPIKVGYEENYPIHLEKALFGAIDKKDMTVSLESANKFFDWMEENYPEDLDDIRLKCMEFVLWCEHLVYEQGGATYHFQSRKTYLSDLMALDNLHDIRTWFVGKVETSCRNAQTQKDEKSDNIIDKAKNYIDKCYSNKDMSLDDVSREVDISPYYFSKLFKEETGVNFIEYLTDVRIEKAKKLIVDGRLSMKEICIEVGYSDPNYFSRTFKKNVGVTPTEYKEQ